MFKIEEHEAQISQLSDLMKVEGIDQSKVSLIIQDLRKNYAEISTSLSDENKKLTELTTLNENLRTANMGLLADLGEQYKNKPNPNPNPNPNPKPSNDKILSLDDISKEFLK
jgi:DNA-binding MarR family transcriptional regulator